MYYICSVQRPIDLRSMTHYRFTHPVFYDMNEWMEMTVYVVLFFKCETTIFKDRLAVSETEIWCVKVQYFIISHAVYYEKDS